MKKIICNRGILKIFASSSQAVSKLLSQYRFVELAFNYYKLSLHNYKLSSPAGRQALSEINDFDLKSKFSKN